ARTGIDLNGWPKGDIRYDGGPIPVPAGMKAAPGSDGHLTIVSADRRRAWDMWRCKQSNGAPCDESNVPASGYRAAIIVQWDLTERRLELHLPVRHALGRLAGLERNRVRDALRAAAGLSGAGRREHRRSQRDRGAQDVRRLRRGPRRELRAGRGQHAARSMG